MSFKRLIPRGSSSGTYWLSTTIWDTAEDAHMYAPEGALVVEVHERPVALPTRIGSVIRYKDSNTKDATRFLTHAGWTTREGHVIPARTVEVTARENGFDVLFEGVL